MLRTSASACSVRTANCFSNYTGEGSNVFQQKRIVLGTIPRSLVDARATAVDTKVVYQSMIHCVPLTVCMHAQGSQQTDTKFSLSSPLYEGKFAKCRETCLHDIAPFRALLQSPGAVPGHNMEYETAVFQHQGILSKTYSIYPKLPRGTQVTVAVPLLRNIKKVSKGEVLTCKQCAELSAVRCGCHV